MPEQPIVKLPRTPSIARLQGKKNYLSLFNGIWSAITATGRVKALRLLPLVTRVVPLTGTTQYANLFKDDETFLIAPAGTIAALAFIFPTAANSQLGQLIRIQSSQIITALTITVNGGGTVGGTALTAAAVNVTYIYQCTSVAGNGTWTRLQ